MDTEVYIKEIPIEDAAENYSATDYALLTKKGLADKLSVTNIISSKGDDRYYILHGFKVNTYEPVSQISSTLPDWGNKHLASGIYIPVQEGVIKEYPFVLKGTAPIIRMNDETRADNWGTIVYSAIQGTETFYLSYNEDTGYIRRSSNGTSNWKDLTQLGKRSCIFIFLCSGGGAGGGKFTDGVGGTDGGGGGGGGGAFASFYIDFLTFKSSVRVRAGKGGAGNLYGNDTDGGDGDYSEFDASLGAYKLNVNLSGGKGGKKGYSDYLDYINGSGGAGGTATINGASFPGVTLLQTINGAAGGKGADGSNVDETIKGCGIVSSLATLKTGLRGYGGGKQGTNGGGGGGSALGVGTNNVYFTSVPYGGGGCGHTRKEAGESTPAGSAGVCIIH